MKQFKSILLVLFLLCLGSARTRCEDTSAGIKQMEHVTISLLTCSPGHEIYAQYGHTALRYHDSSTGKDMVINYGMFSSSQPYFIPRFIFGLTDYRMDVEDFETFYAQYAYEGRGVTEQKLNISNADKYAITLALQQNVLPENIVYRYNFFYDNCTSRARDMIVNHLHGKVVYHAPAKAGCSFRDMIHEFNQNYPWTQFGEDMLLGVEADRATTKAEQQFLPMHLMRDFEHATYNGKPLVSSTEEILQPNADVEQPAPFPSPMACVLILALIGVAITAAEHKLKVTMWGFDLFLMLLCGLVGIVLTLMIFSQHPCVRVNLLLLFFNPLPLFYAWRAIKRLRNKQPDYWWMLWSVLIVLGLTGQLIQHEHIEITILALILLIRSISHINFKKLKANR